MRSAKNVPRWRFNNRDSRAQWCVFLFFSRPSIYIFYSRIKITRILVFEWGARAQTQSSSAARIIVRGLRRQVSPCSFHTHMEIPYKYCFCFTSLSFVEHFAFFVGTIILRSALRSSVARSSAVAARSHGVASTFFESVRGLFDFLMNYFLIIAIYSFNMLNYYVLLYYIRVLYD